MCVWGVEAPGSRGSDAAPATPGAALPKVGLERVDAGGCGSSRFSPSPVSTRRLPLDGCVLLRFGGRGAPVQMTPCGDDRLPPALAAQTKAVPQLRPLSAWIPCPRSPPSLQFGKQIDILNKRKQKFSSQTTLPLWGGAKSAPRIASRATDAGRGLGPETRASRGGRRHGSAQALAARPCSLPSAGEGLAVPQSAGRARAQLARRFAQDYCIAAAPGVQACVCACVCVRLCVCTQPRPSLPGAAVPAPPPVPPPPLPLAAARAPARPRGSNCEFAR